jgi:hypothetical protein
MLSETVRRPGGGEGGEVIGPHGLQQAAGEREVRLRVEAPWPREQVAQRRAPPVHAHALG